MNRSDQSYYERQEAHDIKHKRNMSKTIDEQISGKCIHFNGLMNRECKKGIKYEDVKVPDARPIQIPCAVNTMFSGGSCEFCQFPTPEEVQKEVSEISAM